jgi:hypothetical protein
VGSNREWQARIMDSIWRIAYPIRNSRIFGF